MAGLLLSNRGGESPMRKMIAFAAVLVLFVACQQKTEREVTATSTTETTTYTAPDTAAATAAATDAANDAAYKTGTAMETAGQEIQKQTTDTTKTDTHN
jgi:hypothetical protein